MKSKLVKHKNLNNGQEMEIHYPLSDKEFTDQLAEIFDSEHYKEGQIKNGVYVDIGANIGLTALYFAPYARKYYAIEPSSECFEALKLNTQSLDNIEYFNFAILPIDEPQNLLRANEDSVPQTFFMRENKFGGEQVKCKKIDQFFKENNIEHVDVLKIDVEGAEFVIFPDDSFGRVADKIDLIIGEAHYSITGDGIPEMVPVILKKWGFKTEFVKLKSPNLEYKLWFRYQNGKEEEFVYQCSTIFKAWRENGHKG